MCIVTLSQFLAVLLWCTLMWFFFLFISLRVYWYFWIHELQFSSSSEITDQHFKNIFSIRPLWNFNMYMNGNTLAIYTLYVWTVGHSSVYFSLCASLWIFSISIQSLQPLALHKEIADLLSTGSSWQGLYFSFQFKICIACDSSEL